MTEDDFYSLTFSPAQIIGVYNYCDRWCERCPFSDRCVVHASSRLMDERLDVATDPLLEHLKSRFASVREAIDRRWTGWNLPDELFVGGTASADHHREFEEMERRRERLREHHPLMREARAYEAIVHAWFDAETEGLKAHADETARRADVDDLNTMASPSEMTELLDAVAIVQHDVYLIGAKVYRALDGREEMGPSIGTSEDPVQNDYNGSAKVALLSLDRSESAWRIIHRWYGGSGTAVMMADQAGALRTMVEREFPDARRYLRAGFDGTRPG
jgi:hypothetical protein